MAKSKTKPKSSKPSEKWKLVGKRKSCPKCGVGTFLAVHKNRLTCGKCKYTEFTKQ